MWILLTEASSVVGLGHLMRCKALAQELEQQQMEFSLLIRGEEEFYKKFTQDIPYQAVDWLNLEESSLQSLWGQEKTQKTLVVDSYKPGFDYYQMLLKVSDFLFIFDDVRRMKYPGGCIINGALHAASLDYGEKVEYRLVGADYQLFRKELKEVPPFQVRDKVQSILISLGGSQVENLLRKIIWEVQQSLDCAIHVISPWDVVLESANDVHFHKGINTKDFLHLAQQSDLCICAGGQTLLELLRIGAPVIAVEMVENQQLIVSSCVKEDLVLGGVKASSTDFKSALSSLIQEALGWEIRKALCQKLQGVYDGKAAERLIRFVEGVES